MLKNYFKIAWRNLLKKKIYSFINITGLGMGMACCALIFMFVKDELSFDNYHVQGDRIYRVIHGSKDASLDEYWVWNNAPIGPALKQEFPEIEKVVQFSGKFDILLSNNENSFQENGALFMDSTVFDVFSWKLLQGDKKTALVAPNSIVLTESAAHKYFGDANPMGKVLKSFDEESGNSTFTVTGIIEEIPSNSHFRFNVLLSMSSYHKARPEIFDMWNYADFYTYFLVNENFNRAAFEQKIPDFLKHRRADDNPNYMIAIEPLQDVYLKSPALRQPGETASMANIYIFSVVGIFILIIAMINFMNLSTARSMERAKEVGIRKSIGAERKSLIFQFLGESLIIVFLAAMVSIVFIILVLPAMTELTGKEVVLLNFFSWQSILLFLCIIILIGLLAGSYPAFILSSFKAVSILKGINKSDTGGVNMKKALVVFQFSLSIALMAGTMIVYSQMNHIMDKDMGFDKELMLVLDYNYDPEVNDKMDALKAEMEANPSITSTAFSRSVPGSFFPNGGTDIQGVDGEMIGRGQPIFQVGWDFITHYDLELVAGRTYSRDHPSDLTGAIVINEAAARQYGYTNPADIIGKKFDQWGRQGEVIGVVKDFNYISLHRTIEPLTLPLVPDACRYLSLKVKSENLPQTIAEVENIWKELAPHRPFLYSFLDEDFNKQYESDLRFRKIFTTFSILAIFIACLGLLGLATYTAEQRTKEIGIRKVLGADVSGIVALLSKDFIKLVIIAIIIATPVSWYAMNKWLEDFAYKVEVSWWIYVLAGIIAIIIALLTISSQAIKAALKNPVHSLKAE